MNGVTDKLINLFFIFIYYFSSCATKVAVTCSCLRKSSEMRCCDVEKAYQKLLSLKVMEDNYSNFSAEKRILKRSLSADKYRWYDYFLALIFAS